MGLLLVLLGWDLVIFSFALHELGFCYGNSFYLARRPLSTPELEAETYCAEAGNIFIFTEIGNF